MSSVFCRVLRATFPAVGSRFWAAGAAVLAATAVVYAPVAAADSELSLEALPSRKNLLARQQSGKIFAELVIGGGATGLGVALDASTRGLSTCLVERGDYSSGTSSRSTKLIRGGMRVRHPASCCIWLVFDCLFRVCFDLSVSVPGESLHELGLWPVSNGI